MSDENAIERFEREAAAFYRDTGVMAPGKDVAAAYNDYNTRDLRRKLFDMWYEKERLRARVEELERELAEALAHADQYAEELKFLSERRITDEMIDKAWKIATSEPPYQDDCLAALGVVACEECGGSGQIDASSYEDKRPCDFCQGHGWVRRSDE